MPSHKTLKSVARSVAESFTSLMNYRGDDYVMGHIVRAAWTTNATALRVNLLTGATDSSPLLVPMVRSSIDDQVKWLPDLVRRSSSDMSFVHEAELHVTVDPATRRPAGPSGLLASPFTCTVRIVDDRGKVYAHRIADWWYPESNPQPLSSDDEPGYLLGTLLISILLILMVTAVAAERVFPAARALQEFLYGISLIAWGLMFLASYYFEHKTFFFRGLIWVCERFSNPAGRRMAFFYFALTSLIGVMAILAGLGLLERRN